MVRFRHPNEEWQVIPPVEQNLTVGRDNDGHFFMHSNQKGYDMQLTDIAITKGTGRLDERSDITIRVRNNEASDYINELYLVPYYLGHITPEEYGVAPADLNRERVGKRQGVARLGTIQRDGHAHDVVERAVDVAARWHQYGCSNARCEKQRLKAPSQSCSHCVLLHCGR